MRRSPVKVGAMCAAILFSSIAYAQQKPPASQDSLQKKDQAPKPASCLQDQSSPLTSDQLSELNNSNLRGTWTLFLVAVPYNGPWTITSVAAFNTQGVTYCDCEYAKAQLNSKIPGGLRQVNVDAKNAEGSRQYLICLPGTAPTQQRSNP